MGVKNCPETPRQRMISLMYLVLTAMLALNVDKSVLDAFAMVDQSFMKTIENFTAKNARVYADFNNAAQENPQKAGELNKSVMRVKAHSDSLYHYVAQLKEMIVKKADGPQGDVNNIDHKDNLNIPAELMIVKKHGTALKKAIEEYRASLLSLVDPKDSSLIAAIYKSLDTSPPPAVEGQTPSWEVSKFEGYPLIGVITLMSKMQSDIRNAESDVINHLYTQIDARSFKFNQLQAQVVSKSDYILEGGTYEAKVFLSAIDTTAKPEIIVGGTKLPMISAENAGLYKIPVMKEGKFEWSGRINYKNPEGSIVSYPFKHEYEVAKPSSTVSPTKMNVLYAGLANPLSISVPGISAANIKVSVTNGRIEQNASGYLVYPEKVGVNSVVTVSAQIDGTVKTIGSTPFRVKKVPDPMATVANKNAGLITRNELIAEQGVYAEIPDFDFEMKFTVTSFVVSTSKPGGYVVDKPANGNRFTQEQLDLMKGLNSGSRLYIDNIVVKGDDGTTRSLSAISFKIK
jgi:gliding motility-associated protein GldM